MKRLLLISLFVAHSAFALCTISISSPTAAQTISGTAFPLSTTPTSCPSEFSVQYTIDSELVGTAYAPANFTRTWNTNDFGNGPRSIVATAYDANGALIATSAAVAFINDNVQTYQDNSGTYDAQPTVTPSCTVSCSGDTTWALNATGTWSTARTWHWYLFVDGNEFSSQTINTPVTNPAFTLHFDTRRVYDGTHLVTISVEQDNAVAVAQWQQQISTLNGAVPTEIRGSAHEIYLVPGGPAGNCSGGSTCTLSATVYNADRSVVSSPAFVYNTADATQVTINASTGAVAIAGTAVLPVSVQLGVVSQTFVGTGKINSATQFNIQTGGPIDQTVSGFLNITGGAGCNVGIYSITSVNSTGSPQAVSIPSSPLIGTTNSICNYALGQGTTVWAYVNSANSVPHFGRDGSILTAYNPTLSLWHASMFQNSGYLPSISQPAMYSNYCPDFTGAGWNTSEFQISSPAATASSVEGAWESGQTTYKNTSVGSAQTCNIYIHLIGDNWFRDDLLMVTLTNAFGAWTTQPLTYAYLGWAAQNTGCTPTLLNRCYGTVIGGTQVDEVASSFGFRPLLTGNVLQMGTNGLTSIVASAGTCTANWAAWSFNGGGNFVIHNATAAGFNSVSPAVYHTGTSQTSSPNSFTFSCGSVANGTYNTASDPNLVIEHEAFAWTTINATSVYTANNAFSKTMGWINAATGRPRLAWVPPAATNSITDKNWMGDPAMSDYCEFYYASSVQNSAPSPNHWAASSLLFDQINVGRSRLDNCQDQKPVLALAEGVGIYYIFTGYNEAVASRTGDIITTTAPHGLYNVLPGNTRIQTTGDATYNGNYYVRATPTATTIQFYVPTVNYGAFSGTATLHFDTGVNITASHISGSTTPAATVNASSQGCTLTAQLSHTFTITGTGLGWDTGGTFYYPYGGNQTACGSNVNVFFYSVPTGSSSGGNVSIIPDNTFRRGVTVNNGSGGYRYVYGSHMGPLFYRAAGIRTYLGGYDPNGYNPATGKFGDPFGTAVSGFVKDFNNFAQFTSSGGYQSGPYAGVNNGESRDNWWAAGMSNLLIERWAPYLFQSPVTCVDPGLNLECTARTGSLGSILVIQSLWDTPNSITTTLTPYLQSGQKVIKQVCNYLNCTTTELSSGTSSDTAALDSVGTVYYIFPVNEAAEYSPPNLSVHLADVANATSVAVQYAYEPYPMNLPQGKGPLNYYACPSATSCSLPVDLKISTVYYKLIFMNSGNGILAISDQQTIAQQQ